MTLQHIDAAIAFLFVMLVLGLLITAGTQIVVSLLGLRGSNLRRSLVDLFETACPDPEPKRHARVIARRVLRDPMISDSVFSRFCIRADRIPFLPPEAAGKMQWAGGAIPLLPWILGAVGGFFMGPLALAITKRLFIPDICRYSDVVAGYVPFLNLCQHPWRTGAIVGAILVELFSRWRLASSIRVEELFSALERLSDPLPGTLPDPAQRAMFLIAWSEHAPGSKPKAASAQTESVERPPQDFDEGIVRHVAKPDADEGMAVAVASVTKQATDAESEASALTGEKEAKQALGIAEKRLEGPRAWFDYAMDRASQRFTVQARLITIALSLVFVFAAHLDAFRLFKSLSADGQLHAQLAASAEAITKQAEQISRTREGARSVVPDVYRKALTVVLRPLPAPPEQSKPKPRAAQHVTVPPSPSSTRLLPNGGPAMSNDLQNGPRFLLTAISSAQAAPPAAQKAPETPAKKEANKSATPPKPKTPAKEREKVPPPPPASREDKTTLDAKAIATKALESRPAFASREDAVSWLRSILDGNPALEGLVAAYEQEVNGNLVSDADKLIDHSASLKRELARSEFQLLPDEWPGWKPTQRELPGLLITAAFLSLGAAFLYNTLKNLASLRPQMAIRQAQEHRQV